MPENLSKKACQNPELAQNHPQIMVQTHIYDGNVVIQERDTNNNPLVTYTRGLDLSHTLQGAGGIGGLLARTDANGSTFYHADGNGNVTALLDGNENIVARYLYNPYGKLLGQWGTLANANMMRFSSKEWNDHAGLYYYLYRFYDPNLQRWPNRDPLGEEGGMNLYAFCSNGSINYYDPDGCPTTGGDWPIYPPPGSQFPLPPWIPPHNEGGQGNGPPPKAPLPPGFTCRDPTNGGPVIVGPPLPPAKKPPQRPAPPPAGPHTPTNPPSGGPTNTTPTR